MPTLIDRVYLGPEEAHEVSSSKTINKRPQKVD